MNKELCRKCHQAIGESEFLKVTQQFGAFKPGTYHLECYKRHRKHMWIIAGIGAVVIILIFFLVPFLIISGIRG